VADNHAILSQREHCSNSGGEVMISIGCAFVFSCQSEDFDGWRDDTVVVHASGETEARQKLAERFDIRDVKLISVFQLI